MPVEFEIQVTDEISADLREIIRGLSGDQAKDLAEQGGRAAVNAAAQYHREFSAGKGWRGPRYMGKGGEDGSGFGADVARGWSLDAFDKDGATIANDAPFYAHKVRGGTITPKRGKWLTIPMIPEARGMLVRDYQRDTGHKLFRPKGHDVLMESTGKGTARTVYLLLASVTQGPWPGALPPEELLAGAYVDQYEAGLEDIIDTL